MSNLWFFRLKRAEQQRRRSSGEQSVGSASVHSVTGLSASSAPIFRISPSEISDDCNDFWRADNSEAAPSGAGQQQGSDQKQQQRFKYHGHRRSRQQSSDQRDSSLASKRQQSDDDERDQIADDFSEADSYFNEDEDENGGENEPRNSKPEVQAAATGSESLASSCWRQRRQRNQNFNYAAAPGAGSAASAVSASAKGTNSPAKRPMSPAGGQRGAEWAASGARRGSRPSSGDSLSSLSGRQQPPHLRSGQETGSTSPLPPPLPKQIVPQVNIICSDSTNSISELLAAPPAPQLEPKPEAAHHQQQQQPHKAVKQRQVLVELVGGRRVCESKVATTTTTLTPTTTATATSSSAISRHQLKDQLSSGQVPPIFDKSKQQERAKVAPVAPTAATTSQCLSGANLMPNSGANSLGLAMADSMDNLASLIPRVRVEFYNNESTIKEQLQLYFIKDHTVSLYVRTAKLILKVLACYLYVCRVIMDRGPEQASCYGCQVKANSTTTTTATTIAITASDSIVQQQQQQQQQQSSISAASLSKFDSHPYDGPINFRALLWVDRGPIIWSMQTSIAVICLIEALLMQYLTYKNSIFSIISFHFTLELITNLPFIISIFWRQLRTLFVPGFLSCWLAKQCLEAMLNDLSIVRQSSVFSHRLTILSATVFCLIFTSACGFQHTQRSGGRSNITIFESIYFVVVTFSTVGYGDFKPETWPPQLFIMVMICVALIVLPTQFEQLAYFWIERKKLGASYAHHSTRHEKHVVVCSTTLRADTIMDFLNEFYAHPLLQTFSVVLLSPCELDTTMKLVLATPTWNSRVVYIQGSALKATDLIRARMQSAEACFILAARNYNDRSAADEHTILRSWAIRDFSPYVPQYVQIFRTENKIHVAFAEHVVCDDEFKYALLANNCLIPGTSTLVTLLLHTSQHNRRRRRRHKRRHCNAFSWLINRRGGQLAEAEARKNRFEQIQASINAQATGKVGNEQQAGDNSLNDHHLSSQVNSNNHESSDEDEDEFEASGGPEWKKLYGKCSANEIYHIRLSDSRFFSEYQGKSFTYASFHSHRKFGVALIGVQTDMRGTWPIMLNPGPSYVLKSGDILFYINITKEENSTLRPMVHQNQTLMQQQQQQKMSALFTPTPIESTEPPTSGLSPENNCSSGGAQATYIRIEASSPTVASAPQQQPVESSELRSGQQLAHPQLQPKKHSVADGASIVARSLCSVAGFAGAEFPAADEQANDSDNNTNGQHDFHYLAAKMLAKRNSSASASGAIGAAGGSTNKRGSCTISNVASRPPSRNASTLELAAIATGLRKGSNMSITSTKSRDASPTRLAQVVSGLAVKMKRVKLGKSLTHLTIPRMDLGGGSSASSTESFVNARGRRPSIAPVPAMMGESEEHDSDHEREQESYFSMSWQSASESSPIVKKFVFCTTYVGVSPTLCYLLQKKKPACCLQLINACEHCPFKNARQYNWQNNCVILASDFASNGIYNFLVPLRAHSHNPNELRPIVLLLERKPSPQFIDAISWFPMVYWMPGSIDNLDDLIKAGINQAHSVVVTNKESTNSAEEDYLADCNTIVAVQSMFKMFPSVGIITELSQSSNMRFMQFRAHDVLYAGHSMASYYQNSQPQQQQQQQSHEGSTTRGIRESASGVDLSGLERSASQAGDASSAIYGGAGNNAIRDRIMMRRLHSRHYSKMVGKEMNSHAYKYRLPFAAGNVFSASMLDTLLYQAFVKDYMITMVRLLLGIDQAPGSGFLSSMKITKEDLWIRTYGRLYQRLCSTTCEIPLGIYRTEPLDLPRHDYAPGSSFGAFTSQQASYEQATEEIERVEITNMVKNRLQDLGMLVSDYDDSLANRTNTFSYVIINPNCDIPLREGDIIYLIRPSPIHSRKLFMHRANSVRHAYKDSAPHQAPPSASAKVPSNPINLLQQHQSSPPMKNCPDDEIPHFQHSHSNMSENSTITVKVKASKRKERQEQQQQQQQQSGERRQSQTRDGNGKFNSQTSAINTTSNPNPNSNTNNNGNSEQPAMKTCFSDGDFNEILIKVNNHDDDDDECNEDLQTASVLGTVRNNNTEPDNNNNNCHELKYRRRSSCSDAEDSRRSS